MKYDRYLQDKRPVKEIIRSAISNLGTIAIVFFVLLIIPIIFNLVGTDLSFMIEILIFGVAAYGVQLLYGYTGLLSFGHAAFFGIGSYATTMLLTQTEAGLLLVIGIAVVATMTAALFIGYLVIRQYGIYFAILTLAFAEVIRFAVISPLSNITGGVNGLPGAVPRPPIDIGFLTINLTNQLNMYYFVVAIAILWLVYFRILLNSQMGRAFIAVRENEERARSIGYNVQSVKLISFIVSSSITGIGGALYAVYIGFTGPQHLHWLISGELLIIMILGGAYTFIGPLVGAGALIGMENFLSAYIEWWAIPLGLILITVIHIYPSGILGVLEGLMKDRIK